jgi:hypothetical protein
MMLPALNDEKYMSPFRERSDNLARVQKLADAIVEEAYLNTLMYGTPGAPEGGLFKAAELAGIKSPRIYRAAESNRHERRKTAKMQRN